MKRKSPAYSLIVCAALGLMSAHVMQAADDASAGVIEGRLLKCRDDYGPKKLRLWPNAYDLDQRSVPLPNARKPWPGQFGGHAPYG